MKILLTSLRNELYSLADEKVQQSGRRFFKEEIKAYVIKTALVSYIAKEHFKSIHYLTKEDIFILCGELWKSGYLEESFIACQWSYFLRKQYKPDDFNVFEGWLHHYLNNWASCDTLCNHTIGGFVIMYSKFLGKPTSQAHQLEVFNYVMRNKEKMPRTALRYAIEKLPLELRKEAMKKE